MACMLVIAITEMAWQSKVSLHLVNVLTVCLHTLSVHG